jgi:hypothetical protein
MDGEEITGKGGIVVMGGYVTAGMVGTAVFGMTWTVGVAVATGLHATKASMKASPTNIILCFDVYMEDSFNFNDNGIF